MKKLNEFWVQLIKIMNCQGVTGNGCTIRTSFECAGLVDFFGTIHQRSKYFVLLVTKGTPELIAKQ